MQTVGFGLAAVLALAACASVDDTAPSGNAGAAGAAAGSAAAVEPSEPEVLRVSANTASLSEVTAALRAAGVKRPERWAAEVLEYRPYDEDDPNLTKLRKELKKYKPGKETTEKIISALYP
jgi:hypothetical protein